MKRSLAICLVLVGALLFGSVPAQAKEMKSPKKVVAVSNFQVTAQAMSGGSGPWNQAQIGRGMRSMLVEALVKTGKFIVVERGEGLQELKQEQAIKKSGASRGSGAETNQLMAAQALFRGEITDFTPNQQGVKAGVGGFKIGGVNIGKVGAGLNNASIASIVRWFDTSTGEVLDSFQSEAKATAVGFDVKAYAGLQFGTDAYTKTPIGRATSEVIVDTVNKIVEAMEKVPFQCKIIKTQGQEVFLNVGGDSGISVGDRYEVYSVGEELVDPDSGNKLGTNNEKIGTVKVAKVQPKFSVATFEAAPSAPPKPGDVARELGPE